MTRPLLLGAAAVAAVAGLAVAALAFGGYRAPSAPDEAAQGQIKISVVARPPAKPAPGPKLETVPPGTDLGTARASPPARPAAPAAERSVPHEDAMQPPLREEGLRDGRRALAWDDAREGDPPPPPRPRSYAADDDDYGYGYDGVDRSDGYGRRDYSGERPLRRPDRAPAWSGADGYGRASPWEGPEPPPRTFWGLR